MEEARQQLANTTDEVDTELAELQANAEGELNPKFPNVTLSPLTLTIRLD